jgi:transcriptional regulator GlxA family with amidase domain
MAKAADISPFHLTRVFKKALGMSPHQYLTEVRVHSAHALLAAGGERPSLAEVASAVGFSDQSHLTRQFKRILGTTPKRARG